MAEPERGGYPSGDVTVSELPFPAVNPKRRSLPGQLRYLAQKLHQGGDGCRLSVAVALEAMADEADNA